MTATVEQIESWIVDVPTIRPHKLSMTTMGCQSLVIVRLTRSTASAASAKPPPSAA